MTDSCETCRFWREPGGEEGTGECHRYAPRPTHEWEIAATDAYARFPMTYDGDWCGEFVGANPSAISKRRALAGLLRSPPKP